MQCTQTCPALHAPWARRRVSPRRPLRGGRALKLVARAEKPDKGKGGGPLEYYSGLVTNDLAQDNKASSADMLVRNMQLAGGVSGVLALLVLAFLASNGIIRLPS